MQGQYQPSLAYSIYFSSGPLMGQTFPITKTSLTLGRAPDNDIIVNDSTVSRFHARLMQTGTGWNIEKLILPCLAHQGRLGVIVAPPLGDVTYLVQTTVSSFRVFCQAHVGRVLQNTERFYDSLYLQCMRYLHSSLHREQADRTDRNDSDTLHWYEEYSRFSL